MAAITSRVTNAAVAGAGTITCTTSSAIVTGTGTSFNTSVTIGQQLSNSGGTTIGTVLTVDSATQITLVSNAAVAVTAGAYNIVSTGITTKNSPLTNAEIDANFINLNNAVVAGANSSTNNVANTLVKRDQNGAFAAGAITVNSVTTSGVTYPTTNATQAQMEAGTDTTTRYMSPKNIQQAINVLALQSIGATTKDMTGFETTVSGSTIGYVDATRVFTLTPTGSVSTSRTYTITVSSMLFYVDGVQQATVTLLKGGTYIFDQSAASNAGHPLRFSTTANGTHSGGTEFTTGVTYVGTPGQAGAYTQIVVPTNQAVTLYYYCANHSGMGGTASISSAFNVWYRGTQTTISTTKTITLSATAGVHIIGLNPTTMNLVEVTNDDTMFTDTILVASIYLNTGASKGIIVGDERHAASRDTDAQKMMHYNVGAIWRSGGTMSYTLSNDSATTLSFTSPILLQDEDLVHTISHNPSPSGYLQQILTGTAQLPTIYMNGTTYDQTSISTTPWVAGTVTARINSISSGSGSLADAGEGKYLNYWIVATHDIIYPIKAVMGRTAYSTQSEAYAEQWTSYDLPFPEIAPMYQVTLLTSSTYAGNKVRIVNVRTLQDSVGSNTKTLGVLAHNQMASLTTSDDHTQYVHISNARTITAAHTFSGNNIFQGTQTFATILVNTGVGSSLIPTSTSAYDLGSTSAAWRHVYTSDLHLSNEKHESGNIVDGTRGNWTVQEGEEILYLINNKNGKRYKFKLEEV